MSPVDSQGAPRPTRAVFYFTTAARALNEPGIMGEASNDQPVRRRVPLAAARAHAPDDTIQPG